MSENTSNQNELNPEEQELTDNTSEVEAGAEATTEESVELDPLEAAQQEIARLKDSYLRLLADLENTRRRAAKDKIEITATANKDLLTTLIPVADDFERAMASFSSSSDVEAIKEGVDLIYTKFFKALESKGLSRMDAKGEKFDAEIHDAIAQFPAPSEDMKDKVIDEVEKGYYLNGKVVRFAKVVVGV